MGFKSWQNKQKAIATALATAMVFVPGVSMTQTAQANPLMGSSDLPLELSLEDLDNSWRKFKISGVYEFADLMKAWSDLFNLSVYNNTYFTQGKTIKMAGEEYLIAYRLPVGDDNISLIDMFSSSQWGGTASCDESMESTTALSATSTVSLALLNPDTIGSLNDIQPVDIEAEIKRSEEQAAAMQESCLEKLADNSYYEAESTIGAINRSQQAIHLEEDAFADNLENLGLGLQPETDFYNYSVVVRSPNFVTSEAFSKVEEGGLHFVGGVAAIEEEGDSYATTITIICESDAFVGQVPAPPIFDETAQMLSCPTGSYEVY